MKLTSLVAAFVLVFASVACSSSSDERKEAQGGAVSNVKAMDCDECLGSYSADECQPICGGDPSVGVNRGGKAMDCAECMDKYNDADSCEPICGKTKSGGGGKAMDCGECMDKYNDAEACQPICGTAD